MNNTRIRYVKNPDGALESMQVLKAHTNGVEYKTIISPDGKDGYVLELPSKEVKFKVAGTSAHKTKIAIKSALKALGVVFLNEKRSVRSVSTTEG